MLRFASIVLFALLIAAGTLWVIFGDRVAQQAGWVEARSGESESLQLLKSLDPKAIKKVECSRSGDERSLTLIRSASGEWTQPGDWPVRQAEANALVEACCKLTSRFAPVPLDGNESDFGLNDASTVSLATADKTIALKFAKRADSAAFLRVDGKAEVLRIPPDVLQLVNRPFDEYRRKQLFPDVVRTKLTGDGAVTVSSTALPGNSTKSIDVTGPDGRFVFVRRAPNPTPRRDPDFPNAEPTTFTAALAEVWEWQRPATGTEPVFRDRVDPAKLKAFLSALPDLFVEGFPAKAATDAETKLDKSERTISVNFDDGRVQKLRIGGISRTITRKEMQPAPPGPFPMPPTEVTKTETLHFAKFDSNPLIFEVKADKFADLFPKGDDLRDGQLARFAAEEATAIEIAPPPPVDATAVAGGTAAAKPGEKTVVKLAKRKGNPNAERDEDKQDRWYVGDRLAEASKVTELLEALAKLEAKEPFDRIDDPKPESLKDYGKFTGFRIAVTAQAKVIDGDAPQPERRYAFELQGRNAATKKLAIAIEGWPGLKLVDDAVVAQAERGPLAYRSRKLFDTAELKLDTVAATKADGTKFELTRTAKAGGGTAWNLTQPVQIETDSAKASKLTGDLSGLEAVEFVDDAPTEAKLTGEYGLAKPRFRLDLGFSGPSAKPQVLEIGSPRLGKGDSFARLLGGGVFAIKDDLIEPLSTGALGLLPGELWSGTPEQVASIRIQRGTEAYTLASKGTAWNLAGPFDATANASEAVALQPLLASPKAEKYEALAADAKVHGLDKPLLTATVTLNGKDGAAPAVKTLIVGNPVAGGTGRYAQLADGPNRAVFQVNDATVSALDKPALAWLDRTLLTLDPAKITKIELQGTEAIVLDFDEKTKAWKTAGFDLDTQAVSNLVLTATNPTVIRFAAYGPNVKWADYGLEKPSFSVTLLGDAKPHTIQLGKEEPSGERFARIDGGPGVAVVSGAGSAALARGKLELADRTLLNFDPTQLLGASRKQGKDEFELASSTGWDVVKPAKFKADGPTVDDLVDQLSRLRAMKVAALEAKDAKPFGLDAPAAEWTLNVGLDKPKSIKLAVGAPVESAKPDGDRYVRVDGAGPVKVLLGSMAKKLLAAPVAFKDKTLAKFIDADKLIATRGDRKATFAKVDGTWKMIEPLATAAEQTDLDDLINLAAKLRADEIVAEKATDLKPYGLDAPKAKLEFQSAGKPVLAVLLGNFDSGGKRAYARVEGTGLVALLDASLTAKLLGEFRKRDAWSGVDASQVQTIAVSAGKANFGFRKEGMVWFDTGKPGDLPDSAAITDTLAALAKLKAERYAVDKDANLKLYGLDQPSYVIVVSQQGGTAKTLQIGGEVGGTNGKQRYAKVADKDRSDVFVLSTADTALLTRDRAGYAGKK